MSTVARDVGEKSPARTRSPLRFVSAASLFDGHDAAINLINAVRAAAEGDIEAQETRLASLNDEMLSASESGDGERIAALSRQIHACQTRIEARFEVLETLFDQKTIHERRFEKQLKGLG